MICFSLTITFAADQQPVGGSLVAEEIIVRHDFPVIRYSGKIKHKHRHHNQRPEIDAQLTAAGPVISFIKTDPKGHFKWGVHYI